MSTTAPMASRGDPVESVETPALIVDLGAMERR